MELPLIFVLIALFVGIRLIRREEARRFALIALSAAFPFIFQPLVPIRGFAFWFPFLTLTLTLTLWAIFREARPQPDGETSGTAMGILAVLGRERRTIAELGIILAVVVLIPAARLAAIDGWLLNAKPPRMSQLLLPLLSSALLISAIGLAAKRKRAAACAGFIALILALLIVQKFAPAGRLVSVWLRLGVGQSGEEALASDLRWFGYSYIAFRLLSVAIEGQGGRKFAAGPGEFLCYVCFPPTLSAGPIDRFDRFLKNLNAADRFSDGDFYAAAERITLGLLKKFILADALSYLSLSARNAAQFQSGPAALIALYAYAFQLYFDFAGYSDIAIGIGRILGVRVPENFNAPYLKRNIALFWNNWHMTLTGWIRSYCFNPLTRALRRRKLPQNWIIAIGQALTMTLIGLWHGATVNYLIWGLWNALGLFIHQLYADGPGKRVQSALSERPRAVAVYNAAATLLTFHFVAFGWIFFALPTTDLALTFIRRLFG